MRDDGLILEGYAFPSKYALSSPRNELDEYKTKEMGENTHYDDKPEKEK